MKKLSTIAKDILAKNPGLKTRVEEAHADKKQYKVTEVSVTTRLCGHIGKREGQFVKRNELIWEIINQVNGETNEDELVY